MSHFTTGKGIYYVLQDIISSAHKFIARIFMSLNVLNSEIEQNISPNHVFSQDMKLYHRNQHYESINVGQLSADHLATHNPSIILYPYISNIIATRIRYACPRPVLAIQHSYCIWSEHLPPRNNVRHSALSGNPRPQPWLSGHTTALTKAGHLENRNISVCVHDQVQILIFIFICSTYIVHMYIWLGIEINIYTFI